jgi:chitodextrinase
MAKKLVFGMVLVVMLLSIAFTATTAQAAPASRPLAACRSSQMLSPYHESGSGEHHNWLSMRTRFNGSNYTILNLRTYQYYHWDFWNNDRGYGRFGVSTLWTWWNPMWIADPWLLIYDC